MNYYHEGSTCKPDTKNKDAWGYYNGVTNNSDLVPRQKVQIANSTTMEPVYAIIGGADRTPNEYARDWSISALYYPDGGYEYFFYEPNQGIVDGDTLFTPGVRVARIQWE